MWNFFSTQFLRAENYQIIFVYNVTVRAMLKRIDPGITFSEMTSNRKFFLSFNGLNLFLRSGTELLVKGLDVSGDHVVDLSFSIPDWIRMEDGWKRVGQNW